MEIAKALVLVGPGRDGHTWSTAPTTPKHLFPVANRPILTHNLDALSAAGVLEAAVLAMPGTGSAIERTVGSGRKWGLNLKHVRWTGDDELISALAAGYDFMDGEPVLVQQGDALLRDRMHTHVAAFARER